MVQSAPVAENQKERFVHLFHPSYMCAIPSATQKKCDSLLHKQRPDLKDVLTFSYNYGHAIPNSYVFIYVHVMCNQTFPPCH